MMCFGFLIAFHCALPPTPVVSDWCRLVRPEAVRLRHLSKAEIAALQRPHKEAIAALVIKYDRLCK